MDKFFKRKSTFEDSSSQGSAKVSSTRPRIDVNIDELEVDPAKRKSIYEYHINDRDRVRRRYLQIGPCQPKNHVFPTRVITGVNRRFNRNWFKDHGNWLEYSVSEDAAYCLCCYLFKDEGNGQQAGGESFVTEGFNNWKKGPERLRAHVGNHNSGHSRNAQACRDLMTQEQHIQVCVSKQSEQTKQDYRVRLTASVKCIRFLLKQGLAFRGHVDKDKLVRLAQFYPNDFSDIELALLDNQLQTYFFDVTSDPALSTLNGIDELAQKMVETGRHLDYTLVYLLLKLSLILPVATASVERAFSAMKLIKTPLRNRMNDDLLHDCLVPYVEKGIFDQVSNEAILQRFQNMRERRGILSRSSS